MRVRTLIFASALLLMGCGAGTPTGPVEEPVAPDVADLPADAVQTQTAELEALPQVVDEPPAEPPEVVRAPEPSSFADLDTSDWLLSPPFYAAGDEPYWRLDTLDGWFVFRRAGLPEIETPMVTPARQGDVEIFESGALSIHLSSKACRSISGATSRYTASVWFDDVEFTGCAFEGASVGASAEATAISDSLRAIDSCLARMDEPTLVTGIYERGSGQTALGLRLRDGRMFECVTLGGGAVVEFLDPVEPGGADPWMKSGMRFLRAGQGAVDCDGAEEVTSGGQILGHMLAANCRF